MQEGTCLYADLHVDKYKEEPITAATKIAAVWCENPTKSIELWGCDWAGFEFIRKFLDECREKGRLEDALGIWWLVHNCPGGETEPCFHDNVCQWVIDYSKEHGLESRTEWLKPYGMDKFQSFVEIAGESYFAWWDLEQKRDRRTSSRIVSKYPNPKDENGRFIPLLVDKRSGETIHWPKNSDGRWLTVDELDEQGI